ncbi:MAG: protein-disulfide reductase DsbD [Lysobacter sp.]
MRLHRYFVRLAVLGLLMFSSLGATAQGLDWLDAAAPEAEFLEARDVFRIEQATDAAGGTRLQGVIAPGYYLYRHRLKAKVGGREVALMLPDGQTTTDEFFGTTEIYRDTFEFGVANTQATTATLHWQGCADAGICYPPQTMQVDLAAPALRGGSGDTSPTPAAATAPPSAIRAVTPDVAAGSIAEDQAIARRLAASGPWMAIALFFGMGLLLAFTPCVLPMIPIVSSLVVGGKPSPARALGLSAAYVLPMATVYAALGVVAGLSGANLQAALQHPWLLGAFAALFVVLALSMFGVFQLQLPAWLRSRLDGASRRSTGGSLVGAATLGVLSALLVGPCMTAPLAGALLYIGQSGSAVMGGLSLFALGVGMGVPLLLIAMFGARVLPKPGPWMTRVQAVFGFVLLALAVSMLDRFVGASISLVLWGAWLMAVAAGLMALAASSAATPFRLWGSRTAAATAVVWAVALLVGGAGGGQDPWQPLAGLHAGTSQSTAATPGYVEVKSVEDVAARLDAAGARGQWTLVDFYADWCVSCHVIEREVFGDPRVASVLAQMQVLRPDVTANDATDQALMRHWEVQGPPTLMLIAPDGREQRQVRVVGEIDADGFLARLQSIEGEATPW